MILFFDEDMGTAIPRFLKGADRDVDIRWLRAQFPTRVIHVVRTKNGWRRRDDTAG